MGAGDYKLMALFGAWLGWQMLPLNFLVSTVAAAIVGSRFLEFAVCRSHSVHLFSLPALWRFSLAMTFTLGTSRSTLFTLEPHFLTKPIDSRIIEHKH